jgi:hypothetical protein
MLFRNENQNYEWNMNEELTSKTFFKEYKRWDDYTFFDEFQLTISKGFMYWGATFDDLYLGRP